MALLGLGTDIVEIARIVAIIERSGDKLAQRILHPHEWADYQQHPHPARLLAKRFAAKEAAGKALGCGIGSGLAFNQIEITHNADGKPAIILWHAAQQRAAALAVKHIHISLSDERHYACATVIIES